jgi:hypothetical protein
VADTRAASFDGVDLKQFDEASEFARALTHCYLIIFKHRDARRVITTVFETLQAGEQHLSGVSWADVSYDSTHEC